jgi:hypothetical protein
MKPLTPKSVFFCDQPESLFFISFSFTSLSPLNLQKLKSEENKVLVLKGKQLKL